MTAEAFASRGAFSTPAGGSMLEFTLPNVRGEEVRRVAGGSGSAAEVGRASLALQSKANHGDRGVRPYERS